MGDLEALRRECLGILRDGGISPLEATGFAAAPINLAAAIDHTALGPTCIAAEIDRLCEEARRHSFATVCLNPKWVERAASQLSAAGGPGICTVVGFPLGANHPRLKAEEAAWAFAQGATEIDMVLDLGSLLGGADLEVVRDIRGVVEAVDVPVKVILETASLTADQQLRAAMLARLSGAAWLKTSTGFGPGGATVEAVARLRAVAGDSLGVKASGGIRDRATAEAMLVAGANRIGASASLAIIGIKEEA